MARRFALTTNDIKVTDAACAYFADLLKQQAAGGMRLSILSGKGCGGNEYDLQYADAPQIGDDTLPVGDTIKLFIPMVDTMKLIGTTLDYRADELGNTRLVIDNPNEKGRCGCGESVVF
jgi:iron-sulfur cluster assembly protein